MRWVSRKGLHDTKKFLWILFGTARMNAIWSQWGYYLGLGFVMYRLRPLVTADGPFGFTDSVTGQGMHNRHIRMGNYFFYL